MAFLINIGELSDQQSDRALNLIYKAIHDHGNDDEIWLPHPSPFVRRLIELFTQRGLARINAVRAELSKWISGEKFRSADVAPQRPAGMMDRWTDSEMQLVQLYLESLPPSQFHLEDWMMVVDMIVQRYLPEDALRTEAEWLAVRASLMGRVQANLDKIDETQADKVLAALPATVAQASEAFTMSPSQDAMMRYARTHCAEAVVQVSESTRHRLRYAIMDHEEQRMMRAPGVPGESLETRLFDEFATLNRDWRRIAVTEAGEAANQGMVLAQKPGARLKRVEMYAGACGFCRKIDGRIMVVADPSDGDKDGDTQIWPGKTNIGRSAAPRMRVGGALVERPEDQRWWVAAGVQHPHCRGTWVPVAEPEPGDDPAFAEWLDNLLNKK